MPEIKQVFSSKTVNFALLLTIAGALQANMNVFQMFLTPEQQGVATMLVGVSVAVLRYLTTKPLADK